MFNPQTQFLQCMYSITPTVLQAYNHDNSISSIVLRNRVLTLKILEHYGFPFPNLVHFVKFSFTQGRVHIGLQVPSYRYRQKRAAFDQLICFYILHIFPLFCDMFPQIYLLKMIIQITLFLPIKANTIAFTCLLIYLPNINIKST